MQDFFHPQHLRCASEWKQCILDSFFLMGSFTMKGCLFVYNVWCFFGDMGGGPGRGLVIMMVNLMVLAAGGITPPFRIRGTTRRYDMLYSSRDTEMKHLILYIYIIHIYIYVNADKLVHTNHQLLNMKNTGHMHIIPYIVHPFFLTALG